MATLAQLQAERWWGREIVPTPIVWLASALCTHYRLPAVHAGSKGDRRHLRGAHRSQEWIKNSRWCTDRTYMTFSNLTESEGRYTGGIDFTPGSAAEMIAQCQRLDRALRAGELEEVVEFYGNVDGDRIVDGWNNILNRRASADSSHLWHWHLGLHRKKITMTAARKIFATVTGQTPTDEEGDDDMPQFSEGPLDASGPRVLTIPPVQAGTAGWGRAWLALGAEHGDAVVRVMVHADGGWRRLHDTEEITVARTAAAEGTALPAGTTKISLEIKTTTTPRTVVGYRVEYGKA